MKHMLHKRYGIQIIGERLQNNHVYFYDHHYYYVTMTADNKEAIYSEQRSLAYYLIENGFYQTTQPIANHEGVWYTEHQGERIIVFRMIELQTSLRQRHGKLLAHFHQMNNTYPNEPRNISSYSRWHKLWINKLTLFENEILNKENLDKCSFYKQLRRILPYIIGISENAIQYVNETRSVTQFNEADKATITFQRYKEQLTGPSIIMTELVYDHFTRDIAEYIRNVFLYQNENWFDTVTSFLKDYSSYQNLSLFSWRLLYARLLFPIHLFDIIGQGFQTEDLNIVEKELNALIKKQPLYEKKIKQLFNYLSHEYQLNHIPHIHWL